MEAGNGPSAVANYVPRNSHDASQKQVAYLVGLGVSPEKATGFSKRQAGIVIDKITSQTGADYVMRFGKYKGNKLSDLPPHYLEWASNNINNAEFQQNLDVMWGKK